MITFHHPRTILGRTVCWLATIATVAALLGVPSSAEATDAPQWRIVSTTNPTTFVPGHTPEPHVIVVATNVGGAATDGTPTTISDSLPTQFSATSISGYSAYQSGSGENGNGNGESAMHCSTPPLLECTYSGQVDPGDALIMTINLSSVVSLSAEVPNMASVIGGGAPKASAMGPMVTSEVPAKFGPTRGSLLAATSTSQAGAHPNMTTSFTLNTAEANETAAYPRDVHFDLPQGFVGSTVGMPRCSIRAVIEQLRNPDSCPSDTMVGATIITLSEGSARGFNQTIVAPIYNIAPASGEPAAFAFNAFFFPARLDTSILSNGNYGVRVTAGGIPQTGETLSAQVTFWGVPADHNGPGEDKSLYSLFGGSSFGGRNQSQTRVPFLTNPQQCSEPLVATMSADSWTLPGIFVFSEEVPLGKLTGCEHLSLRSFFTMRPDTLGAGVPAGYLFDLSIPQTNNPETLATPNVKDVKLTLPVGTVVNPSVASGLKACSDTQFGLHSGVSAVCPSAAKLGAVEVRTPSLPLPLKGELYLGEPECSPCTPGDANSGKMLRFFLQVVGEGEQGVIVKLEGRGEVDQQTGQVTTVFKDNPQLPFEELKLSLSGGSRAALANPRICSRAMSNADITPWSTPFTPDSQPSDSFEISERCFGPQFKPSFVAGTSNPQAAGFSPFTLAFGRSDQDQFLSGVELHMPPGLLGRLSNVTRCREPQAAEGLCGPESLIGHVQAQIGAGVTPYLVDGGQAFLTDGYKGAPFGLSIVVPAVAGPYTLAGTTGHGAVVVRAGVSVDPQSAAITVKSDPLPIVLNGIPLQVKAINATIDRREFMFNPTDCRALTINGTLSSSEGANADVASPFQAVNCAALPFKPKFSALTQGKASKASGASLHVKLSSGHGQANIGQVKVNLPLQLPSRLSTLQKACTASIFAVNPASCPAASVVGDATAVTPVLKSALRGPAILVSHGGAAFPDLDIVLQGEGITLELSGNTKIKKGITSSTFKSVPDAPFNTFDLVLPAGPHSVLATNLPPKTGFNLCGQKLSMPTEITGQNGAVVKQTTKIAISGCHKANKRGRSNAKHVNARKK